MDPSVPPGKDFYRYATGHWQDTTAIPADRAAFGISDEIDELTTDQLLGLLSAWGSTAAPASPPARDRV